MEKSKIYEAATVITFIISIILALSVQFGQAEGEVVFGASRTNALLFSLGWLMASLWWGVGAVYHRLGEK